MRTRTGARRKDLVRILRKNMLWKMMSRNMEKEQNDMDLSYII